jgi:hypothetical protein
LESLGFEWKISRVTSRANVTAWEVHLSDLADYRKIHGHSNVPSSYGENIKLAGWVLTQRTQYRLYLEGKTSHMTPSRFQDLESLGFEWDSNSATWEVHLSELADFRKIHGHCNVPHKCSENAKLHTWVKNQRTNYRLHRQGKPSPMTTYRIQALEKLGVLNVINP